MLKQGIEEEERRRKNRNEWRRRGCWLGAEHQLRMQRPSNVQLKQPKKIREIDN
jgi:hypothetical protein